MIKKTISIVTLLCTLAGCNAQKSAKNIEENEVAKTDQETVDTFTTSEGTSIKMYCIKHGSVRMQIEDKWIYVDPVTNAVQPATDFSTMPKADYIFVTHEHFDHLDSVAIRQLTKEGHLVILRYQSLILQAYSYP